MGKDKNLANKAKAEAEKEAAAAAQAEAAEAASWSVGAKKDKGGADKEAEKLRKQAEKAALLAEDEAALSSVVVKKAASKKKKGKDDFADLQAALASAPKTAAQKAADKKAAEDERKKAERARVVKEAQEAKAAKEAKDLELAKQYAAKGMVSNHTDLLLNHKKEDNVLQDDALDLTGLDSAVEALSSGLNEKHPRMKAIYTAYYNAQLPVMKEELPGLKLSQYKERIYENFQKAPENPNNQTKTRAPDSVFDLES